MLIPFQAEVERVEKLVAKMQKKAGAGAGPEDNEDVVNGETALTETGGAKEPTHSRFW